MEENVKFEYVHSNQFKSENASQTNGGKDGFEFTHVSKNQHNVVLPSENIEPKKVHQPMNDLDIMVNINFIKKIKERCSSEDTVPNKIYEEELSAIFKSLKTDEEKKIVANLAFVGVAHPNIFKSIDVFQKQETAAVVKHQHAIQGKPAPPRKKLEIFKYNQIKTYKKMLIENDLTLDCYVTYVMPLLIFRKTKNVSENESDISDSEEENGDLMI
ncbi:unnamed protein product [Brachionus calyciflorus]|uniref:Uncharacterized protein n=1 Tax=Brachionus calyciflorus TaxID=104777 RepID=A0A814EWN3_9BILA|nr:unnamed protein product [Brachionus calyciflorus]